uniref:Uncharacterized protein n=1 Tax=Arundo donax TaxID=35708 RepID=A0A0A9E1K9_ARUDO
MYKKTDHIQQQLRTMHKSYENPRSFICILDVSYIGFYSSRFYHSSSSGNYSSSNENSSSGNVAVKSEYFTRKDILPLSRFSFAPDTTQ